MINAPWFRKACLTLLLCCFALFALHYHAVFSSFIRGLLTLSEIHLGFALLALTLYPLTVLLDCLATRIMLCSRISVLTLLRIRMLLEPSLLLPGGAVAAEVARPLLWMRHCSISEHTAVSVATLRKALIVFAHFLSVLLASLLGYSMLERMLPGMGTVTLTLAAIAVTTMVSLLTYLHSRVCDDTVTQPTKSLALKRFSFSVIRQRLSAYMSTCATLTRTRGLVPKMLIIYLCVWTLEAFELLTIGYAVNVALGFNRTFMAEMLTSLLRGVATVLPGGVGVQEFGYASLLRLDTGIAAVTAIILLRRARELIWLVVGSLIIASTKFIARKAMFVATER